MESKRVKDVFGSATKFQEILNGVEKVQLNSWEQDFVVNLKERFKAYGEKTYLSEKQIESLTKIVGKESK